MLCHWAKGKTSVDDISLGKLNIILAALQWRLLTDFSKSELVQKPHKTIPYLTDGKITLKYNLKRTFLGRNLERFSRSIYLNSCFWAPTYVVSSLIYCLHSYLKGEILWHSLALNFPKELGGNGLMIACLLALNYPNPSLCFVRHDTPLHPQKIFWCCP